MNWKFLVFAPLTLLALTACPEHSRHGTTTTTSEPHSRYGGLWINDDAYQSYLTYLKYPDGFCQDVQKHPGIHGANLDRHTEWGNQPHPEIWRVFGNGQVYEWTPTLRASSPDLQESYIGHLHEDGFFVKIPFNTGASSNVAFASSYVGDNSGRDTATLNFVRDDLIQLFPSDRTIRARKLDRINDGIALDYYGRLETCVGSRNFRAGGVVIDNGGDGVIVQDQGASQPIEGRSTLRNSGSDGGAPALPARKVVRRKSNEPRAPVVPDNVDQQNDGNY